MISFVKDVSSLSNNELLQYSVKLSHHEKEVGLQIIACLREAEKRKLFCELGLSSLWEFATKYLGLSNGNAQVKIDAMRLSRDNPIAKEKIETGELSILNAAKVNSFFRQERKAGKSYTREQKTEVIESVLGLSQSKCERALLARSPESIPAEKIRPLTETKTELKIVVDEKTMANLERLRELLSNKMPVATYADLLNYLVEEKVQLLERKQMGATLEELQEKSSGKNSVDASSTPTIGVKQDTDPQLTITASGPLAQSAVDATNSLFQNRRSTSREYISVHDRRWAMRRAQGQCEHVGKNGYRCSSRRQLHVDHVIPLALGGRNDRSNYPVLCKQCNLYYAKLNLGKIMDQYVPSFK